MAIFTAIGSAIAAVAGAVGTFIGGLGAVGSFLLRTAVGIGLNLLAQAIAGKPKDPAFSINGTLQAGGDVARSLILGRTATAGSLVWVNTWGNDGDTPNAYLTQVIALADLPVASLDEVWVNGEKITLGPTPHAEYGYPATQYNNSGADHLWVKFYDGTQTAADSFLVTRASNGQRQWQSTRVGRGVAYAIVTAKVSKNMFSGIPNFKFVVSGSRLYDPSKDSTVPGGSGVHRWAQPETWGGDGDHLPAVQIYNLLRGIQYNGQWFYGLQGMTAARLPTANWIRQINKCRAASNGNATYRAGGEIPVEAPLATAIEALLTACQGRLAELGGIYDIYVGEPDAPVASFTDGDILSTEEQSFTPFFGLADTINGIAATYPSPEDGWAVKSAPPLYRADLEALAGNRRLMADVSLDFVPYDEQVQRLMKSALLEGQRARRHTLVLPPQFWPYAVPGAILSWTSERNGYVNKLFRVDGAVDRANLDVMIDITEVDPADYDWIPATDYKPPVDGAIGVIRPAPQPLIGWQVFPATIGHAGKEMPSIRVAYPGQLDDVRAVRVQVRLAGETEPIFDGEVPYGDPATNDAQASVVLAGTFAPNTDYQARGVFVPYGAREAEWSEWLPVTTPNVWLSLVYTPGMLEEIDQHTAEMLAPMNVNIRDLIETARNVAREALNQDAGQYLDRQSSLTKISSTYDNVTAEYQRLVEVATGPNSALGLRIETLEIEMPGKADLSALNATNLRVTDAENTLTIQGWQISGIQAALPGKADVAAVNQLQVDLTDLGGVVTAQGSLINGVEAKVDGVSASGLFRTAVVATETGALSTIGLSAAATANGATSQAAMLMSARSDGKSMIGFLADMVYFTDGSGNSVHPVVIEGGAARMNVANIGTVNAGVIQSPDNKFKITLTEGKFEWWD